MLEVFHDAAAIDSPKNAIVIEDLTGGIELQHADATVPAVQLRVAHGDPSAVGVDERGGAVGLAVPDVVGAGNDLSRRCEQADREAIREPYAVGVCDAKRPERAVANHGPRSQRPLPQRWAGYSPKAESEKPSLAPAASVPGAVGVRHIAYHRASLDVAGHTGGVNNDEPMSATPPTDDSRHTTGPVAADASPEAELEAFDLDGDGKISIMESERARLGVVDARLEELAQEDGLKGTLAKAAHELLDKIDND